MPPRILVEHARDFTGGLNLDTDPYNLADNESPFMQNVDPDRRGGFSVRRGERPFIDTITPLNVIDSAHTFVAGATRHLLIAGGTATNGSVVYRWDGAAWQSVHAGWAGQGGRTVFVEMNGILYMLKGGGRPVRRWTGTGAPTELAFPAYNDNIAAPAAGTFVRGDVAAVHNGVMWVGCIFDSTDGGTHLSRLRWSHPGQPEDWRTNDWIDIDPDDGAGRIRALLPFGDRLLVFKDSAVYAVHGYPPEGFSVTAISREVGAPSQQAVCRSENTVWWWDAKIGLCQYDGKNVTWPFDRLYPLIDDRKINMAFSFQVIAAYHNQRVWLSVPYDVPPYEDDFVGLVFDPFCGKNGAWTLHTATLFSFHVHRASDGGDAHLIGGPRVGAVGADKLQEIDVENYYEDLLPAVSATSSRIEAFYQTRWFDAKNPALKKRWKRPIIVVGVDAQQPFIIDVFDDYDPSHVQRTFQVATDTNGNEGVWDDNVGPPPSEWDEVLWALEVADRAAVLKGSPLGTGISKALRFSNSLKGADWRVHGVTMKWIPKRIRN